MFFVVITGFFLDIASITEIPKFSPFEGRIKHFAASKIANLHSFIAEELPDQYKTTIGERGVRLSGGQRQRIGIARAMYHNPQVLILDEATSALDNQTEKIVMDAINNLNKDTTIILIAHRLTTVKKCDIIIQLDKGKLISKGTFDELLTTDDNFKSMSQKN